MTHRTPPFSLRLRPWHALSFEKLVKVQAKILMLGAQLDTITMLHYAEHLAQLPDKQIVRYRHLMPTAAGPQWLDFEEFDTSEPVNSNLPENIFEQIAEAFLETGQGQQTTIGQADAFVFNSQAPIPFAIRWLVANPLPNHTGR